MHLLCSIAEFTTRHSSLNHNCIALRSLCSLSCSSKQRSRSVNARIPARTFSSLSQSGGTVSASSSLYPIPTSTQISSLTSSLNNCSISILRGATEFRGAFFWSISLSMSSHNLLYLYASCVMPGSLRLTESSVCSLIRCSGHKIRHKIAS